MSGYSWNWSGQDKMYKNFLLHKFGRTVPFAKSQVLSARDPEDEIQKALTDQISETTDTVDYFHRDCPETECRWMLAPTVCQDTARRARQVDPDRTLSRDRLSTLLREQELPANGRAWHSTKEMA